MGLYGNLFLEINSSNERKYESIYDYMYIKICDKNMQKVELCEKYVLDKISPIKKIVSDSIKALHMQDYCKEDFNINRTLSQDASEWSYYGIPIAIFCMGQMVSKMLT